MGGAYLRVASHIRAGTAVARKVPGHDEPDSCQHGSPAWVGALGNNSAYSFAKKGVLMRDVDWVARADMIQYAVIAAAAVRIGAAAWPLWPKPGAFSQIPRGPAADPAPAARLRPKHVWRRIRGGPASGTYQFGACKRTTRSLSYHVLMSRCKGSTGLVGFRRVMLNPQGHQLMVVYPEQEMQAPFLACDACGAWTTGRPKKLARPCAGRSLAGGAAIRRLARGRHPDGRSSIWGALWVRAGIVSDDAVQFTGR